MKNTPAYLVMLILSRSQITPETLQYVHHCLALIYSTMMQMTQEMSALQEPLSAY